MPSGITWGNLQKAIDDGMSIDAAIASAILQHNLDASAHGQSGEAINVHRSAPVLDHLDGSVRNQHVNVA